MIIIAGTIDLDPATRDAAIAAAQDMMAASANEAGCVSYVFSADFADPGRFHLFEEWDNDEALEAHVVAPHMAIWREQIAGLGVTSRDINRYDASNKAPL